MPKILITGACGQIGSEMTLALRERYGKDNVLATDIREPEDENLRASGAFEYLNVLEEQHIARLVQKYKIDTIYHLVGILSAAGEKNPDNAWMVNVNSLKNVLDLAKNLGLRQVFWPSSIAAFGPGSPRENTPQATIMDPNTIYGITKWTGELLCNYYYNKYRLDVRSLRYPGLISYVTPPGGGTTDYAIDIFYQAIKTKQYICFLREDTMLPMMYMDDAIGGTVKLMEAPAHAIRTRLAYNFTAISFTPKQIADEIKKHIPGFVCTYAPDRRQTIADTWPRSVDDSVAQRDWGWKPQYTLSAMVEDMLKHLKKKLKT
ncbi:MAG: NAD-dependent epimerase/dehydratase family protein [Patescibacteria group bacterium]|nr:NAD-dependent epimerase/dehydratase family protein [Patescibacteria group bacterium]MDD5715726.1 NAD-dependent epimerase/dehydratase family protein [Patescibacteria group bacterium]